MTGRVQAAAGSKARVAGPRPAAGTASAPGRPVATARRRAGSGPILLVVALLATLGVAGGLVVQRWSAPPPAPETARKRDPFRVYAVADAIDHRQMRPVWNLVNMTGIERQCEKARAFTVAREADGPTSVPTRFVIYCRDQGFWVVEADPERERWGTVGPLATREEAEAAIDREGEFVWGARPPRQRSFIGGLAPDR